MPFPVAYPGWHAPTTSQTVCLLPTDCWSSQHQHGSTEDAPSQYRVVLQHGLSVAARQTACLHPTDVGPPNTSRGSTDKRPSQTSRSESHGVTAAYLPPMLVLPTPAGAAPTNVRPQLRGLGDMARLPPTSYRCRFPQHQRGQSRQPLVQDLAVWESWRECRLPPTGVGSPNTSRGRADNRSSQTSRSGSHGATAAYLLPVLVLPTPAGAEPTNARPKPRGLGVMA